MKEVLDTLSSVSLWIWLSILVLVAAGGLPLMYVVGGKRGAKRANRGKPEQGEQSRSAKWKDRILFVLAIMVGALVYGCVVYGSFKGLTAFGDTIGFNSSNDWIVPVTLDGVAAAFGFLAFRAVLRGASPVGCYVVVWMATGASATFNYLHGDKANGGAGGLYFAFLSLVGMFMFHVFMKQFRAKADQEEYRPAKYPPFGLRWITAPYTTVRALVVWINYPPHRKDETARITVREALRHLAVYDRAKAVRRARQVAAVREAARLAELEELQHRQEKAEREAEVQAAESRARAAAEVDVEAFRREVSGEVRGELEARYEQRVAELEGQYQQRAAELTAEQERQVAQFRAQLEQLGGERDSGRDEVATLRAEAARLARELEGMQEAAKRANAEAAAARAELDRSYQARSGDVDELASVRRQAAELEAELRRARESIAAANAEATSARRDSAVLRQERDRAVDALRSSGGDAPGGSVDGEAVIGRGSAPAAPPAPNGGRRPARQDREPEPALSSAVPAPRAESTGQTGSTRATVMGWLDAAYLDGTLTLADHDGLAELVTDYSERLGVRRDSVVRYAYDWRRDVESGKRKPTRGTRLTVVRPTE